MRKNYFIYFLVLLFSMCWLESNAQFSESFEGTAIPSGWTTINNNGDTKEWSVGAPDGSAHDGGQVAEIEFNSSQNHDDYLVTPAISVTDATSDRLTFYARSRSASFLEDFNLLVSTTGTAVADFTDDLAGSTQTAPSTWTEYQYDLSSYEGQTIYIAIQAVSINEFELYIDSYTVDGNPTCIAPLNVQNTAVTDVTADFTWDTETTATTGYNWVVMADGDDPDVDTPVDSGSVATGTTTANATGLSSATDYDFYVQSDCGGGDLSAWSSLVDFTTNCSAYAAPFYEGFANSSTPDCWEETGDNSWDYSTSADYAASSAGDRTLGGDTNYAWMDGSDNGDAEVSSLLTPFIDVSGLTTPAINFFVFSNNTDDGAINTLEVEFYDGASWNSIQTINTLLGDNWNEYIIDLSSYTISGDVQFRFTVTGDGTNGDPFNNDILIDEIRVDEYSDCYSPINVQNTAVTDATADFSWDAETTASTGYNWVVMVDGDIPGVDTPVANGSVTTGTTTANVTGLTGNTDYNFYVQSDCGGGDLSNWSSIISFTTDCSISTAPYLENFDMAAGSLPDCWEMTGNKDWEFANTVGSNHIGDDGDFLGTTSASGDYFAWVDDSSPHETGTTLLSPFIDVTSLTSPALYFYMISDNEGESNVDFSVDFYDGSAWNTAVFTSNTNTNGWVEVLVNLSNYTISGPVQFRFVIDENNGTDFYDDIAIDDVRVDEAPQCIMPSNVQNTAVTDTTADFTWDAEASATTGYNWVIMAAGDDPDTDTPIDSGSVATGTTTANVTGLTGNTDYDFYVQSDCGNNSLSDWSTVVSITTNCAAIVAPYTEDFDTAAGSLPDCWEMTGNKDWEFANTVGSNHIGDDGDFLGTSSASGDYFAWVDDSSPHETGTALITAPVDMSAITSPGLSFYMISNNEGNSNVDFSVDFYDGANWNTAIYTSNTNTNGWEKIYVDLSSYTITGPVKVRFVVDENNGTDFYDDIAIDDVSLEEYPTCFMPSNVINTNVTDSTADFSWDSETTASTGYNWVVMADGDVPGVDTPITSGSVLTGTTTANATGLTPQTDYDFYVQSDCGGGDLSDWSAKVDFTTLCAPVVAPYTENFDTAAGSLPDCWELSGNKEWEFANTVGSNHIGANGDFLGTTSASGDYFAWVDDSASHETGTTLQTPFIDVSGLASPALSFYIISDNEGNSNVDFSVDFYDGANWNTAIYTSNTNTNGWTQVLVDLSTYTITGPVQFRFIVDENNGTDFYDDVAIDDVSVDEAPTCTEPTGVQNTQVTDTTADFTWTVSPDGSEGYEWVVMADGDDPDADTPIASGTNAAGGILANAGGLTENTDYDFYVRSLCDFGFVSDWSTVVDFTTDFGPCAAPSAINTGVTDTTADFEWLPSGDETDGYNWVVMADGDDPEVDAPFTSGSVAAGVTMATVTGLDAFTDYDFYVQANCGGGNLGEWSTIVNFKTDLGPCSAVSNITVDATTKNSVTFSWDVSPEETGGYYWVVMPENGNPDFNTPVKTGSLQTGASSVTVNGLLAETSYDFYMKSICPNGNSSDWSPVTDFTTGSLGFANETFKNVSIYPNPTSGSLNLSAQTSIEKVEVFNLLGQRVKQLQPNNLNTTVDMTNLSSGTYLVRLTIQGNTNTYRVIRE